MVGYVNCMFYECSRYYSYVTIAGVLLPAANVRSIIYFLTWATWNAPPCSAARPSDLMLVPVQHDSRGVSGLRHMQHSGFVQ